MAIDTREKRQAMLVMGNTTLPQPVTPNASADAEWRTEVAWLYPGIALAAPSTPFALITHEVHWRTTHSVDWRGTHRVDWRPTVEMGR